MRKWRTAVLAAAVLIGAAVPVQAGVFSDYIDYEDEDGTYSYYFTEAGLEVTMDEEWYQKTMAVDSDNGLMFVHRDSYEAFQKEGVLGGRLFTLGASVNTSFQELPSFSYIGFDEENAMNYYAVFPTDYQAYGGDPACAEEYNALWQKVEDVVGGIRLNGSGSAQSSESGQSGDTDALFSRVSNDDFSFEIPSEWTSWTMDDQEDGDDEEDADVIYASLTGEPDIPMLHVGEADTDLDAGNYVVEQKNAFLKAHADDVVGEPEIVTYEPEGTDRKLAGYRCVYSSADGLKHFTEIEFAEYIGDDLYHFWCTYVSQANAEGEYEDENTIFQFYHAIDTFEVTDD